MEARRSLLLAIVPVAALEQVIFFPFRSCPVMNVFSYLVFPEYDVYGDFPFGRVAPICYSLSCFCFLSCRVLAMLCQEMVFE